MTPKGLQGTKGLKDADFHTLALTSALARWGIYTFSLFFSFTSTLLPLTKEGTLHTYSKSYRRAKLLRCQTKQQVKGSVTESSFVQSTSE